MKDLKQVISEEIAVKEMDSLLNKYLRKKIETSQIKDAYPNVFNAITNGFLIIDENGIPIYKLQNPILTEDKQIGISELIFKTRVKPTVKADLADGLDLQKSAAKFSLRLMSHVIGQPVAVLDKLERDDYDLVEELTPVFM